MGRISPHFRRMSGLLIAGGVAWVLCVPAPVHAWVLVIRNLTNEAMGVCYFASGVGNSCFGSLEVPPNGTVPASTGTS